MSKAKDQTENLRDLLLVEEDVSVNSRELAHMLLCSFRYSLGRMTYITGTCAEWLRRHWHVMPDPWREQIHRDISEAIAKGHAGHKCDVDAWSKVLALPVNQDNAPKG